MRPPDPGDLPVTATHWILMGLSLGFIHAAAAWALVSAWLYGLPPLPILGMTLLLGLLAGLGITVGFHRLITHRSFATTSWCYNLLGALGALAIQESPLRWCAVHRKHHARSDRPDDPHSPVPAGDDLAAVLYAFCWAHMGWILSSQLPATDHRRWVPDLLERPFLVWIHRTYYPIWVPLSLLGPGVLGALALGTWEGFYLGFLWGGCLRIALVHHVTFSVNSLAHLFGSQPYRTRDESRNNPLVGLLALGEGWHNNHHADARSARQGLHWWQVDLSWGLILAMEATGLAWDVRRPNLSLLASLRKRVERPARAPGGER